MEAWGIVLSSSGEVVGERGSIWKDSLPCLNCGGLQFLVVTELE